MSGVMFYGKGVHVHACYEEGYMYVCMLSEASYTRV